MLIYGLMKNGVKQKTSKCFIFHCVFDGIHYNYLRNWKIWIFLFFLAIYRTLPVESKKNTYIQLSIQIEHFIFCYKIKLLMLYVFRKWSFYFVYLIFIFLYYQVILFISLRKSLVLIVSTAESKVLRIPFPWRERYCFTSEGSACYWRVHLY